jgi:4a-hydroxytetrahydrobiopterin dehydratase
MTAVAMIAEKSDHHPNWKNVYNNVTISLNTHDADGLTKKDFQLAKGIDQILKNYRH